VTWRNTELARRLGVRLPIVQAPMAGGWTPPRLVAQVCEAGALGSIAGAMSGPDELRDLIRAVRSMTTHPFAVNLFAPLTAPSDRGLETWARVSGVGVPPSPPAVPRFDDQMSVLVEEQVPILSFTFGLPPLDGFDGVTIGTATTVAEAVALQSAGVEVVVAQGYEAGGHRGSFLAPVDLSLVGTMALVPQVVDAVSVPVVASGGIMDGRGVAAALALGAQAVQLGTAFLACDEAGTGDAYRDALGSVTTVTPVLTGRPARAVRTEVVERLESSGERPPDYPLPRFFLTEPPMLVGQGGSMARRLPAAQIVAGLERETTATFDRCQSS
jgi:nitronate monooxygenase